MTAPAFQLKEKTAIAIAAAAFLCGCPALAQYSANGFGTTTLRDPLIPGASNAPAFTPAPLGAPPPIGNGPVPLPVTPGMLGGPLPPPTMVPMPPTGAGDTATVNSYAQGSLTPPPSTQGAEPPMICPDNAGYQPPASIVNIQAQGGIVGSGPTQKWNGQTTRDLGVSKLGLGSMTTDFGQNISNLPSVQARGITRSVSQDGPRAAQYPGQMDQVNRSPNLAGAQETQDLYGSRTLFKGANLRAQMTIAPY